MLFAATIFAAEYLRFGFIRHYVVHGIFFIFLIAAGIVDIRIRKLPNAINALGIAAALLISLVNAVASASPAPIWECLAGTVACSLPLFFISFISKRGMGMGDVKFAALIGAFLGVKGGLCALWVSIVLGAAYGAVMILLKKATRKTAMPFGPFMVMGSVAAALFGDIVEPLILGAYHA